MPNGCCGWCAALSPRYKRLVDNIFPAYPHEGLVKSNMETLTFYSLSSPEKLDRIGEYLFQRASRDIYRKRNGFVIIAMEAMDQLLVACHAQTLNLFVESFLKMVQKLLESTDPQLQILATQSFVRFANIEEDTPSYHRRYDFFVSKFSAMCHNNHTDDVTRDSIRLAGIKGLQGVIRKTVSDDLVENIWEAQHMDKIVPSLLFNMQNAENYISGSDSQSKKSGKALLSAALDSAPSQTDSPDGLVEDPPRLAEACLRELVGRAAFGHIRCVLRPVLRHFDLHELWVPNDFAVYTFKIIMFSIQAQYSYSVVESLMTHLDMERPRGGGRGAGSSTRVSTAVADVLSKIIAIAAGESVGPSVLEIINNLLTHLRASVTRDSENEMDEKLYQEALINALGEFADHLPDYQKIDIMMFIVSKVPGGRAASKPRHADTMLQSILLKSLLKVGTKYKTLHLSKAFPGAFLEPLLRLSAAPEPPTRVLLQRILHTLIDRHRNMETLSIMSVNVVEMDLNLEKSSRPDLIFINKHGGAIYSSLYEGLQMESNTVENVEAIYTTLALLCVELASEETICDFVQLILAIQNSALSNPVLSRAQRYHLHALVASLLVLVPYVLDMPQLMDYAKKIIEARQNDASHLLPSLSEDYDDFVSPSKMPYLMVDLMAVSESLKEYGIDTSRLQNTSPYTSGAVSHLVHRHSWVESATVGRDSIADIGTNQITDLDSANSSPGIQRRKVPTEDLSLEAMRRAAAEPSEMERREAEQKKAQLNRAFRTAPFAELLRITQPKHDLQDKLAEIFNSLAEESTFIQPPTSPSDGAPKVKGQQVPAYEKYFPELFLY